MRNLARKPKCRSALQVLLLSTAVLAGGCDDGSFRQLGAKVAFRGQDVTSAAIIALSNLRELETDDFSQRAIAAIAAQPMPTADPTQTGKLPQISPPQTPHLSVRPQIEHRIQAYRELSKAYEAIQQLADKSFADQAEKAQSQLVVSVNRLKEIPELPAAVTAGLPALTGIIVERKQKSAIRKYNTILEQIMGAYQQLWQSDRQLWESYLDRVQTAYIAVLKDVPREHFDERKLREIVPEPYTAPYLVAIYKERESARLTRKMQTLKSQLDSVEEAFRLLHKAHEQLNSHRTGFAEVNTLLDRILTVIENVKRS